ncbi:MAG: TonB-dependent receptor [Myxococcota bacterium]
MRAAPRTLSLLLFAVVALSSERSSAQEPFDETELPPVEELEALEDLDLDALLGLEVVTVTAQKRVEDLQDVPVSVAAVSGAQISKLRTSGSDIRFLAFRVPSLSIESSFGRTFPRLYIRGLGNPDFDLNASQPVSVLLDGVVLENPTLKGFPIFDVDRVEVLRGPQGTLFGRNTPAGIVKIESRRPTQDFEGYGRATYGSFNYLGLEAAANAPIVPDLLAARVSVLFERRDGWVENTFENPANDRLDGFDDLAAKVQVRLTPGSNFEALLSGYVHRLEGNSRVFRANIIQPGTDDFADGYRRDQVAHDGQTPQDLTQYGARLSLEYDVGPVRLISITGFQSIDIRSRGDVDGGFGASFAPPSGPVFIPFPSETADAIPSLSQITEELRIASSEWDLFNFQAGVFVFREEQTIESRSFDTLGEGAPENGFATQTQETTAWALFASAWVDLLDGLRITGGLRYSNDSKDFTARRTQSPVGGANDLSFDTDVGADFLSWDLSAIYEVVGDVSLFARASSSFRAPSIQGRILFGDEVSIADAEDILSFEGGLKALLFGGRFRANLTGYGYFLNDQQLTAVGGGGNANRLINADLTRGYGAELDAELAPVRGLNLALGLSYNNTAIVDGDLAIAPCGSGCTVLDPQVTVGEGDMATVLALIDGNPLPHAPEWIANFSLRYRYDFDPKNGLYLFTNWSYRSRVHFFLYQSEEYTDEFMVLGDLRVGYLRDDGFFEVSAFVANLLDDDSRTGGIDFNNLTGFVNDPRTFGVEAILRF